ncbi:hypothetical protein [Aeromicrobium fastidiosum]|uniref:DUF305 domain-containing protein n=1 Tax=Aeromicrobium fastidiosum TaxID=52699 RepID=A0A641APE2_9ACTN|nr:hypothetical protein [Aeromicrobium fastidiosum]KAA1376509.1 hypothetical protein ESP62_013885 [Aeromicrobium fastidiosum]MBP2391574.1 hypothetical protein [Aeromicrobium fastidiosum]
MMTRRVLIGTGTAVAVGAGLLVAGERTGRLDDVADAVGLDPKPLPDPDDTRVLRRAATSTAGLLAAVEATVATHPSLDLVPVARTVREQLAAMGGATASPSTAPPADARAALRALDTAFGEAAEARARDARSAGSAALVRVLASASAGHAQAQRIIGELR